MNDKVSATATSLTLGDICTPKQHPTISGAQLTDSGYPVYGANGRIGFYSSYTHTRPTIAVTCRGATCGTIHTVPAFSYITGNAMALDNLDETKADLSYLAWSLRARGFQDVISGSAQPQITGQPLRRINLVLPPLDEQRRIAAMLDEADGLRRKRCLAIEKLNSLPQSIFQSMFGEPVSNPKGWPVREIGACLHNLHGGANLEPKDFVQNGFPVLHKGAIKRAGLISTDPKKNAFVTPERANQLSKSVVDSAFVAVTLRDLVPSGPTIGLVADLSRAKYPQYVLAQGVYAFQLDRDQVMPEFFVWLSNNKSFRNELRRYTVGSTQIHLRLPIYKGLKIPLPPITLQQRFGLLMTAIHDEFEIQNSHLIVLERLFASLQQLAFSRKPLPSSSSTTLAV